MICITARLGEGPYGQAHDSPKPTAAIAAPAGCFSAKVTTPESIKVRLAAYQRNTAPLIDFFYFYGKAGLLLPISGAGTPEEVSDRSLPRLEGRRLRLLAQQMWAAEENRRDT